MHHRSTVDEDLVGYRPEKSPQPANVGRPHVFHYFGRNRRCMHLSHLSQLLRYGIKADYV